MDERIHQTISVSDTKNALILFADVVDSSVYSSTWEIIRYAQRLCSFQELFKKIGGAYFDSTNKNIVETFYDINVRGDEGTIFCIDPTIQPNELVYNAVKFSFELKARMELLRSEASEEDNVPRPMKIAIGIHYGPVARLVGVEKDKTTGLNRSVIKRIEGYSINYGKRIESSSRMGKFSKIFLSQEAASLIENDPIVLIPYNTSLKGIENNEEVYEVCSAYFEKIPYYDADAETDNFLEYYTNIENEQILKEPWLKGFIISVLDSRAVKCKRDKNLRSLYLTKLQNFAWRKPFETDPIMLYWRARECQRKKEYTKSLTYYKKIVERYPCFIHARKKMVETCWKLANSTRESSELIFARDTTQEFLEHYPGLLTNTEKRKFKEILRKISQKTKGRD